MKGLHKKIIIISTEFPPGPGGIGSHAYSLTEALSNKGWEMDVFTCGDYSSKQTIVDFDRKQSFKIHRFRRKGWLTYFYRLYDVAHYIRKQRGGEIVIVSGKFSLWIGLWLRLRFFYRDLHILGILHGSEVNLPGLLGKKFTHLSMMACNQLVAVSHYTASIIPAWIRKSKNISIIPNGIDCQRMDRKLTESVPLNLQGSPILLTVGGVTPRKGQHRVIRALPEIIRSYPQACYHIVGLPIYQKQFEELAIQCGVQEHIVFHGVCPTWEKLTEYYKAADLFMLLSENQKNGDVEGFGIVALEAVFFSLPVIGATGCGIDDAIDDGRSGILVNGDNATEICNAMTKILADKSSFKQRSKVWAEQHDWNIVIEDFIRILPPTKA